jgi:hypothetical protein
MVLTTSVAFSQEVEPSQRSVDRFQVEGVSRLAALAKLGAFTNTTFLVEAGDLLALQTPVVVTADHTTVSKVIRDILRGLDSYKIRNEGALLILSTPGQPNRTLTLPLGRFTFTGDSISSIHPLLQYAIRRATGCNPQGYGWGGPPMHLPIPSFQLAQATLEKVVAKVAHASEASMWIVGPEPLLRGCIDNPAARWQVGLYGFGRGFSRCETIFRESVGPPLVGYLVSGRGTEMDCVIMQLPNPIPTFPSRTRAVRPAEVK